MSISLQQVKVSFGEGRRRIDVLDIDALTLSEGSKTCIFGGSGGGKSTLLNVIAGIVRPTSGQVHVAGTEITQLREAAMDRFRAEHIGYVFQTFNLLQSLSAQENIAIAGTFGGLSTQEAGARARTLLDRVGLKHRRSAYPRTLSVGEQQRVGIARALVNRPKVVLADEPTANLDDRSTAAALDLLLEIVEEENATLVLVTHEAEVRARFEDVHDIRQLGGTQEDAV